MKRDMDLVRKIMLGLEDAPSFGKWINQKVDGSLGMAGGKADME